MTGLTYEDLVAAATVGLSHRPLQITGLSGAADEHAGLLDPGDEAAALLDAAALLVTARRAGVRPVPGPARLPAAADDTAPELSSRAAGLLREAGPALLGDLLGLAAGHGYRAPAPLLPVLLDAAVRDRGLTTAVAGVLGARGRWLAGHRADWQRVADAAAAGPGRPGASASADPGVWQTGSRGQRRALLVELREHDPAAAREMLAAGWSRETGDDRADLLAVLACRLSPDDEEFLEAALDDRKEAVRAAARRLLARLPGSAFTRRAAERAAPLLGLERHGMHRRLVARLPGGADAAAVRDGLSPGPRLLTQIVAAAPLAGWVTGLGLGVPELVSLPIAGDLAVVVRAGWRQAAIREADPEWAQALLAVGWPGPPGGQPPATWPPDQELAAVLPPDARAARAASLLAAGAANAGAVAQVAGCPAPWPAPLADGVIAALGHAVTAAARAAATAQPGPPAAGPPAAGRLSAGRPSAGRSPAGWPGWPAELAAVAGRGLPAAGPADYAAALARLAGIDNCPAHWSSALRRAAEAVALRRAFLKEIR
jgi:hypothetical protein